MAKVSLFWQDGITTTYDPAPFESPVDSRTTWKNVARHEQALYEGRDQGYPPISREEMTREEFLDRYGKEHGDSFRERLVRRNVQQ